MNLVLIDHLSDPRLGPYRDLKDRELAAAGELFIAEGHHVVIRLLQSDYRADSILLAERRLELMKQHLPDDIPTYIVPDALIHRVVGYRFHSGVIAAGRRKPLLSLNDVMSPL